MRGVIICVLMALVNVALIIAVGFNWANLASAMFCFGCAGFCLALDRY